jgi:hypothetical protein
MDPMEQMADTLERHYAVIEIHLKDLTDQEMTVRPVPSANNAIWQLGHLVTSTAYFASGVPGATVSPLPAGWKDKFVTYDSTVDDPKAFPSKAELLKVFKAQVEAMAAAVRKLKPADLDLPSPEGIRGFAPTVGVLIGVTAPHWMMHVGQFQVIRRKLGKPVMF